LPQLWVAFTIDTEPNYPDYVPGWHSSGSNLDVNPSIPNWSWSQYWHDLNECFKSQNCPVTWLVRVDDGPVKDNMLTLFRNELFELKSSGDEVGIHIHTWIWDDESSKWVQTRNPNHEIDVVLRSLDMFRKTLGFRPSSARMGWNTMSNEIMRTLDANGVLVDSSAIPGTLSLGKFSKRDNIYDWSRTPREPYHPSYEDYQKTGKMNILEIPISTRERSKHGVLAPIINRLSATKGSSLLTKLLPLARRLNINPHIRFYISPSWSLSSNSEIIRAYWQKAHKDGIAFLVGTFHAHDILDPKTGKKNQLFEDLLSGTIREISTLSGVDITFATLSEMAKTYHDACNQRYEQTGDSTEHRKS
jgi:hypothetical protein